jgi:uncharacterized membrane protein YdjX (TVP38/TMEM64 family)
MKNYKLMQQKSINKISVIAGIILFIALFRYFEFGQYLTLEYLKESQTGFQTLYAENRIMVIASYMVIYILVTGLLLPGAAVLTLAGGGLFGFIAGTIIVSFASTIGATLACLVSRYVLRDWVQTKFEEKLKAINEGVKKEGAFYLLTLRLIPAFPFFVINLVMGLTKMKIFTFFWVSQIGMLPGTMVYVNAGREIAKVDSISGILSPTLIFSFVLLGLFPVTVKKIIGFYKNR